MKRILAVTCAAAVCILLAFGCRVHASGRSSLTKDAVRNLQRFLLGDPAEDLTGEEPYDLSGDSAWTATDLTLMKQELLETPQSNMLVVYFSRTGNTEKIAEEIIRSTGADRFVIEAAEPYSDADIRYQDDSCRANREQNDKTVRPQIAQMPASLDAYDVIWLGYPIWWGEEPRIIDTFLESADLSEKTVIPFCTSGSSGIGTSERNIGALVPIGDLRPGKRFAASASADEIQSWIDGMELPVKQSETKLLLSIGGKTLTAVPADTEAAAELIEKLRTEPVTLELSEYGGFEKVGRLPWALPRNDTQISAQAGDILLYQGNQMTVFYGENAWSYTRLAHLENISQAELAELFGSGDITVTLSLAS